MTEHIYHQYGLATPTDFNKECDAAIKKLNGEIDTKVSMIFFQSTGFLIVDMNTDLKWPGGLRY